MVVNSANSGVCPYCGFWTENLSDHLEDGLTERELAEFRDDLMQTADDDGR